MGRTPRPGGLGAVALRQAIGRVGVRLAKARKDGQQTMVRRDGRVLAARGHDHVPVGVQRTDAQLDRLGRISLSRVRPGHEFGRGGRRACAVCSRRHEWTAAHPDRLQRRQRGRIHHATGGQTMAPLEAGEGLGEAGRLRRALGADLSRDQRQVDVPTGLRTTERRQRGGIQRGRIPSCGLGEALSGLT